jgi:two-component system phosphate regulon sensor histidine kinase PhoR
MTKTISPFYILVAYVLLQFSWWAYALVDLNEEIYTSRIELLKHQDLDSNAFELQKETFDNKLYKKKLMVAGEGLIFFALLLLGIYRTKKAFAQEFALAKQQKNFLLSITHEFKSPLAAVKLNLQTLQKRSLEAHQKEDVIRKALIETDRIHLLVENALMASRLESSNYDVHFEEIDFSEFVRDLTTDFIERYDHDHIVTFDIDSNIAFKGDSLALTSMINNLLENAEKYSPPNTTITITLRRIESEIILSVIDQGNGIQGSDKVKIFNKFYRIGNEDTRKTKGTGLGLFIVSHVVAIHKGKLQVVDNLPKGSIFEIKFPA